jgi:hypothetical protein
MEETEHRAEQGQPDDQVVAALRDLIATGKLDENGNERKPVTIGGTTYDGVTSVPLEVLIRAYAADELHGAQKSHARRRINRELDERGL